MRLYIAAFTEKGARLAEGLLSALPEEWTVEGYAPRRHCGGRLRPLEQPVGKWAGERFSSCDALLFIGAAGIAVRAVAPCLRGKATDPAVLCMDEAGRFVIPLLSGHIGGANSLARRVAGILGAEAAITTATDVSGRFAVDAWAAENGCAIRDTSPIKYVSAAILEGRPVGLRSDFPILTPLPEGVTRDGETECGILLSLRESSPFSHTVWLIPKCLALGIGCRRNISPAALEKRVLGVLKENSLPVEAVDVVASVDLKEREPAILAFCEKYRLPYSTFSAAELSKVQGSISRSDFVREIIGVDNVCERAALRCGGRLLVPKSAGGGVTVALTIQDWSASF